MFYFAVWIYNKSRYICSSASIALNGIFFITDAIFFSCVGVIVVWMQSILSTLSLLSCSPSNCLSICVHSPFGFRFDFHHRFGQIRFKWPGKVFQTVIGNRENCHISELNFGCYGWYAQNVVWHKNRMPVFISLICSSTMHCVWIPKHVKNMSFMLLAKSFELEKFIQ